ncbi:MAG: response regulator [Eubacteriales bacterium]|nr:response regulator [Eubacteriales bacterium]
MLKLLIVDDDALTRKGIRMLMPWKEHQMEIIGEASNGKEALTFLASHAVDLVLVDLDMPVMDGMTFIREASALYPQLSFVVLTIHTEFETIQNILRMGAIDYIAKTQFDKENFDQILERIHSSILKKYAAGQSIPELKWKNSKILYPYIYALITAEPDTDEPAAQFQELNGLSRDFYELLPGIWVFTDTRMEFIFPQSFPNTMLLRILDVSEMTYDNLAKLLRNYRKNMFFYDYKPQKAIYSKHAYELREQEYIEDTETLNQLKQEWLSLNWVHENDLFEKIRFDLQNSRLKPSALYHLLVALETIWNTSYSELTGETAALPPVFHSWNEVEDWLMHVYEKTNYFQTASKYSGTVVRSILNVKTWVDGHYAEAIDTAEVARSAQMSYGYFSRCFHDVIGVSFSDYCISLRIEKAKGLLRTTDRPIWQVAEDVGYGDEKYFSRLFKKVVGCAPSEYRRQE